MRLTPGTRLGPYEVLAPLGAGGMGEVYRARDTRLDRTVAVKVLPPHLSENPQLRQRFQREAKALSRLSHPHICTLHDVGEENGLDFLVMEYLEGGSLADRLEQGPLAPEQVLRTGIEIADALDKAHRQGVIHRDLKPGNIILTKAGAKLLDFGLAKPTSNLVASALTQATQSPSQKPLTAEGAIVGTLQYMAPEQLEGKEADARTDLFALGAVLYEMATGRKAFTGRSQASVIAAILSSEPPPMGTLQPLVPPALDRVVKVCLAKEAEERWQTAHDILLNLKWIAEGGSQAGIPASVVTRRKLERYALYTAVGLLAVVAGLLAWGYFTGKTPTLPAARFTVPPPEKSELTAPVANAPIVSPDGELLAYVGIGPDGRSLIYVRALGSLETRILEGTDGAFGPFWSPDSHSIGFEAGGKLKRVGASGGPVQTICSFGDFRGGAWSPQGVILIGSTTDAVSRVPASGGTPAPVTTLDKSGGEKGHGWPHLLPDGRHFLYMALTDQEETRAIYVASLDSKEKKLVLKANSSMAYAEPGYLFFVREGALAAQRFDPKHLEVSGEPAVVAEGIYYNNATGRGAFSVSQNGVLAWRTLGSVTQLTWYDRTGKPLGAIGPPGIYQDIRLSPKTQWVALTRFDPQGQKPDIWTFDPARGTLSRLTFSPPGAYGPAWSPDGKRIAFFSAGDKGLNLEVTPLSGGEPEALLTGLPFSVASPLYRRSADWSRDGRYIVYWAFTSEGAWDIWVMPLEGDRKPEPFLNTRFEERDGQVAPDSHWLAYASNESGKDEVYVRSFPGGAHKVQISTAGGTSPRWAPHGRELYYVGPEQKLMVVDIKLTPAFAAGVPKQLFTLPASGTSYEFYEYQVAGDGRFLIATPVEERGAAPLTVVVNWPATLKK